MLAFPKRPEASRTALFGEKKISLLTNYYKFDFTSELKEVQKYHVKFTITKTSPSSRIKKRSKFTTAATTKRWRRYWSCSSASSKATPHTNSFRRGVLTTANRRRPWCVRGSSRYISWRSRS